MVSLDWVKMGWGSNYAQQFDPQLQFHMDFSGKIQTDILPIHAALNAINRIAENYPAPYYLFVSGGADSQAMMYAWKKSGVPFTAISVIYIDENETILNSSDTETLYLFAAKENIEVRFDKFELRKFLETELTNYAHKYQCSSPQLCTHMKFSENVTDGTVIFSGNLYANSPGLNYTVLGLYRYAVKSNRNFIPYFFLHDEELVGSFHNFSNSINKTEKANEYERKCFTYISGGFDIIPQQRKMNGFEQTKEYYDQFQDLVSVKERLEYAKHPSRRVFDLVFRYPFTKAIPYVELIAVKH